MRIQFILKKNETYGFVSYTRRSSGLWNSTNFIVQALSARGVHCDIVEVNDNNDIDREVTRFKPDICVIEALWVVPEKFDVLQPLHPNVKWVCHLHSHIPFLALEGIAMEWLFGYAERGVGIIANSAELYSALKVVFGREILFFLPNVYLQRNVRQATLSTNYDTVNIACFGAVRPFKNHMLQALAAIKFAQLKKKKLRFHVNATRVEVGGAPCLKNLRALFAETPHTELLEHPWYEPEMFLDLLRDMDIGMQVSLTETFNVVSADYTTVGLPMVVSDEVVWAGSLCKVDQSDVNSMIDGLINVYGKGWVARWNKSNLDGFVSEAIKRWYAFVKAVEAGASTLEIQEE